MSIRTVLLSLIVAVVLGGAAWYLLSRPEKPVASGSIAPGAVLMDIEPGAVRSIRITAPSGEEQGVERGTEPGTWVALVNAGRGNEQRWPMQTSAAQGLLRRLAETRAIAAPSTEDLKAGIGAEPTVVRIEFDNGGVRTLKFAARTLGERGLVEVQPVATSASENAAPGTVPPAAQLAVVDSNLHKVFREPGPKGWRETRVFSGLGPDVSRIRLWNVDRVMSLGKVNGVWALTDPVATSADSEALRKLVSLLGELTIENFFDDQTPPAATTGLDAPIARIVIETDRNILDEGPGSKTGIAKTQTQVRELLVGKPSDGTLLRRYAAFKADGPVFTIGSSSLTQDTFLPSRYISQRAIDTPVGDIGGVVLESSLAASGPGTTPAPTSSVPPATPSAVPPTSPGAVPAESVAAVPAFPDRVLKRSLDKWIEIKGGVETPLSDDDAKTVNELLSFLAGEGPRSIELAPPAGWTERGAIHLLTLGDSPLSMIVIGSSADGAIGAKASDAKGRNVFRMYTPGRAPGMLNPIAAAAKQAADQRNPVNTNPDNEIMK